MARRLADDREHRRGLVLGLTLAEMLVLLLFLLLLALGVQVKSLTDRLFAAERDSSNFRVLMASLRDSGQTDVTSAQRLVDRLERVQKLEVVAGRTLNLLGRGTDSQISDLNAVLEAATRIDPNDPPAVLRRALEVSEKIGVAVTPEQLATFSQMRSSADLIRQLGLNSEMAIDSFKGTLDIARQVTAKDDPPAILRRAIEIYKKLGPTATPERLPSLSEMQVMNDLVKSMGPNGGEKIADLPSILASAASMDPKDPLAILRGSLNNGTHVVQLEEQNAKLKRERDNLMRGSGRGLVFPSCWVSEKGETEYVFDVTILDGGLVVRDAPAPSHPVDPEVLKYVESFPKGRTISEAVFKTAGAKLFSWSKERECRFVVILRDAGVTSKDRYKQLRGAVENPFYIKLVESRATPASQQPAQAPSPTGGPFLFFPR